jgi:tetratricopeptide (TPR) repeat protein
MPDFFFKRLFVFGSLLVLLAAVYSNSFRAAWQYDDFGNIVENRNVHAKSCRWSELKSSLAPVFSHQVLSRPMAYVSFALNHCAGGLDVQGFHLVNFAIHCGATIFLFLLIGCLLRLPVMKGRYNDDVNWIAGLATAFWALHPIHVTAVTYIVQRMTSMAGLFYVCTLYCFVRGRLAAGRRRFVLWGVGSVCAACALLSKENAILLFPALAMLDLIFFPGEGRGRRNKIFFYAGALLAAGLVCLLYIDPSKLFLPYVNRPFTMVERVLTQPRVIFRYLAILALPRTSQMAMLHDVPVSHSFFDPWTTWAAILALSAAIWLLIRLIPRHRLFAFCGLFFFLNHAVESSMLNLELMYEHRNYIPSMLLFVPLAVGFLRSVRFFSYRKVLQSMGICTMVFVLGANGYTAHAYNQIFRSEMALWLHNADVYPNLSTVRSQLGKVYWNLGEAEKSFQENCIALELDHFNSSHQKGVTLTNLGLYEAHKSGNHLKAIEYFSESMKHTDESLISYVELSKCYYYLSNYTESERYIEEGLLIWPNEINLMKLRGLVELQTHRARKAIQTANSIANLNPGDRMSIMLLAQGYRAIGEVESAINLIEPLAEGSDEGVAVLASLALLELARESGRRQLVHQSLERLQNRGALHKGITIRVSKDVLLPYTPNVELIQKIMKEEFDYNNIGD